MKPEYDQAGIPFDRASERIDRMKEGVQIIKGLFADGPVDFAGRYYTITDLEGFPKPTQRPHPPIDIGGGRQSLLALADSEADIVGFIPSARHDGKGRDIRDATADAHEQKSACVRA